MNHVSASIPDIVSGRLIWRDSCTLRVVSPMDSEPVQTDETSVISTSKSSPADSGAAPKTKPWLKSRNRTARLFSLFRITFLPQILLSRCTGCTAGGATGGGGHSPSWSPRFRCWPSWVSWTCWGLLFPLSSRGTGEEGITSEGLTIDTWHTYFYWSITPERQGYRSLERLSYSVLHHSKQLPRARYIPEHTGRTNL